MIIKGWVLIRIHDKATLMSTHNIWAASWQNPQNDFCAQRRLRSAWTSAQSDQSLRCLHEDTLGPQLPIDHTAKTLIRQGGCPGWSEPSLGVHAILLVLSRGGSYVFMEKYGKLFLNYQQIPTSSVSLIQTFCWDAPSGIGKKWRL